VKAGIAAVRLASALVLGAWSCGGKAGQTAPPPSSATCRGGSTPGAACSETESCPGGGACLDGPTLQGDQVAAIMQLAARSLDRELVVAVTDRRGVVLGVGANFSFDYDATCNSGPCPAVESGCPNPAQPVSDCRAVDLAVQLARSAAFFSADQTPLTSRSVRFLSGEHFPPGIRNTAAAALFGIENTNRGCNFDALADPLATLIPRAVSLPAVLRQRAGDTPLRCEGFDPSDPLARCGCTTGIATIPGAVPIYTGAAGGLLRMAGGIGVVLRGVEIECDPVAAFDSTSVLRLSDSNPDFALMEFAARAYAGDNTGLPRVSPRGLKSVCDSSLAVKPACCGDNPPCDFNLLASRTPPFDPVIFVDGISIPEIGLSPGTPPGVGTFPGIAQFIVDPATLNPDDPLNSAQPLPIGWLVGPLPAQEGPPPFPSLSTDNVSDIVMAAFDKANEARAAIRLPLQARTQMMLAVSDTTDQLLGLFRMTDATVFSIDVAVAKSRNVAYFSSAITNPTDTLDCPGPDDCLGQAFPPGTAITNRTLSFGAQPFFPSGIEGRLNGFPPPFAPGPFRGTFLYDSANTCTNGLEPSNGRQNGIVFFPGSAPLYGDHFLVGGLGVSGDGVEQDDLVTSGGTHATPGFEPLAGIRADQLFVRGVRLPYLKFNRRPNE
jgi:uncharacterized protein GlcG (DUF336 family)